MYLVPLHKAMSVTVATAKVRIEKAAQITKSSAISASVVGSTKLSEVHFSQQTDCTHMIDFTTSEKRIGSSLKGKDAFDVGVAHDLFNGRANANYIPNGAESSPAPPPPRPPRQRRQIYPKLHFLLITEPISTTTCEYSAFRIICWRRTWRS